MALRKVNEKKNAKKIIDYVVIDSSLNRIMEKAEDIRKNALASEFKWIEMTIDSIKKKKIFYDQQLLDCVFLHN